MLFVRKPTVARINRFLAQQAKQPFSYAEIARTRDVPPRGYDVDHRRVCIGTGLEAFHAACHALQRWEMFQLGWVQPCWPDTPIAVGSVVGILASCWGLWWLNACRIVYVIDETSPVRKFGFAYGTLPDHVERGEERFTVEWHADQTVWYDLLAFSRPGYWLVRLGYPLARRLQKRFGDDSVAAMEQAVRTLPRVASLGSSS